MRNIKIKFLQFSQKFGNFLKKNLDKKFRYTEPFFLIKISKQNYFTGKVFFQIRNFVVIN